MRPITHILCPIDLSESSRHAIQYGAAVARRYDATFTALHVVPPVVSVVPAEGPFPTAFQMSAENLERRRQDVIAFTRAAGAGARIDSLVGEGGVVEEVMRQAQALPADLIIMGTHGRSGFNRLILGSVTERLIRKAPCPVLTLSPRVPPYVHPGPLLLTQVVCAVDYSPSSMKALQYAANLLRGTDALLTFVNVVEPVAAFEPITIGGPGGELDQLVRATARHRLKTAISTEVRQDHRVGEIVATGEPGREVVRIARELQSALIVIGVHGGLAGLLGFGSTANYIVREAVCPVLSLRA